MTFAAYLSAVFPDIPRTLSALLLLVTLTLIHCFSRQASSQFQQIFTVLKVALILIFCFVVFSWGSSPQNISLIPNLDDKEIMFSGVFAISLIMLTLVGMQLPISRVNWMSLNGTYLLS